MIYLTALAIFGASFAAPAEKEVVKGAFTREMMKTPQYKLAVAYMKNLRTFGEFLKSGVEEAGSVEKTSAQTAVSEMDRNLRQMQKYHDEAMAAQPPERKGRILEITGMVNRHLLQVRLHMDALLSEINTDMPDPRNVVTEVDQVLQQCDMLLMLEKRSERTEGG